MTDRKADEAYELDSAPSRPEYSPTAGIAKGDTHEYSGLDEARIVRKVDLRLIPWLSLLYLLSFLDRTNIGNANLFGLSAQLGLTPIQYSTALAVFFISYVAFEVPSNMVMKRWRPSRWLPLIMIAWGAIMIGMGFVKKYADLVGVRIALGAAEAGLFPGVSYFLARWYRRYEVNFRIAVFFSAATVAGAFGGLLARLINLLDGKGDLEGWRWIFVLEGILTVLVAFASFWMLHDYPPTARFLNPAEKTFIVERLKLDDDGLSTEFKWKFVKDAFLDIKLWVFALSFQGSLMPVYSFSLFSPNELHLGYTAANAQLLSTPPYFLAALTTISAGYLSDRYQQRGIITMICGGVGALGFLLLLVTQNHAVQYFALFLASAGVYPGIPLIVSWGLNNCGGATKKAVAAAIIVSVGNLGGVISSFIYPKTDAPKYSTGHAINFAWCMMMVGTAAIMHFHLKSVNRKRAAIMAGRGLPTAEEKAEHQDEGDNAPWFVYTT